MLKLLEEFKKDEKNKQIWPKRELYYKKKAIEIADEKYLSKMIPEIILADASEEIKMQVINKDGMKVIQKLTENFEKNAIIS